MNTKKLFCNILLLILAIVILPVSVFAASGFLTGKVIDFSTNKPVAGAVVTLKPHTYDSGAHDYTATTNYKGQFAFGNIIAYVDSNGGVRTWVKYRAYVMPPANFMPRAEYISGLISFQFKLINNLTVALSSIADSGELAGRVFDLDTNAGIAGAQITIRPSAYGYGTHDYSITTGPNGDYVIHDIKRYVYSSGPLPKPVSYSVNVYVPGYPEYTSEFVSFFNQPMQEREIGLKK